MTFEGKAVEDKTVKELLSLLEGIDPETVEVLRDRLKEIEREIYNDGYEDALTAVAPELTDEQRSQLKEKEREIFSAGYSQGLDEGVLRATVPDEEFLLRGEAKGLAWASHAASGGQMAPNTNPYVSPRIIERLLAMGEKAKAEKEAK